MLPKVTSHREFNALRLARRLTADRACRVGMARVYVSCAWLALGALGCGDDDGISPGLDAGPPGGADGGGSAHGALVVSVIGDLGSLEDGQALESASLSIGNLTARNDRGGVFEPMTSNPVTIDLSTGATFELADATPATYARVSMHLAPNGSAPSFALRIVEAGMARTFDVRLTTALDVEARCATPVVLVPGGTARLRVTLPIREIAKELDEGMAPEPIDGVVAIDESAAPDTARALLAMLADAFELQCEPGG